MQLNNFFKEMYYVRFASNKNNQKSQKNKRFDVALIVMSRFL